MTPKGDNQHQGRPLEELPMAIRFPIIEMGMQRRDSAELAGMTK